MSYDEDYLPCLNLLRVALVEKNCSYVELLVVPQQVVSIISENIDVPLTLCLNIDLHQTLANAFLIVLLMPPVHLPKQ